MTPPDQPVEPRPGGGRWVVPAAVAALVAVPAAYLLLRPDPRDEGGAPRGQYLIARRDGGMQVSQFGDGRYGTIIPLDVLAPDVTVGSVTPVDHTGAEVPRTLAVVVADDTVAQATLYGMTPVSHDPVAVPAGATLRLVLALRPDCAHPRPATSVRVTLTVRGRPAEQVVAFTAAQQATHAENTFGVCAGR